MIIFLAVRLVGFLAVPFTYWFADLLNYSQAGKIGLLGGLAILAISAWRAIQTDLKKSTGFLWDTATAAPFFIILALEAFLREFFGVAHDDAIVTEALFNSNGDEAAEFLLHNSHGIMKHSFFLGMGLSFFVLTTWVSNLHQRSVVSRRGSMIPLQRRWRQWLPAVVFSGLFLLIHLNPTMRKADPFLYFPLRYAKWQHDLEKTQDLQTRLANAQSDPNLLSMQYIGEEGRTVVFVLGESTTRLNWSLYGYPRRTTPQLQEISNEILKFEDVITGYPGTDGSIKQIFTPATVRQPDLWMTQPDLLTMAKQAGYKTFWLSNHSTDRSGVASIIASHADVVEFTNKGGSRGEGSYDEILLPAFRQALDDPAPRKFIILHMLGAHPAYNFRYPEGFARFDFSVDAVTKQLLGQGRAFWAIELRNEYDNAIVYMDHMLRMTLDLIRSRSGNRPVSWLFVPDHGEDVAHYSNFVGHNRRVRAMYEVPMIYYDSGLIRSDPVNPEIVRKRPYQLDVLDHTLLGLLGIKGNFYNASNDIFSSEFQSAERLMNDLPYP